MLSFRSEATKNRSAAKEQDKFRSICPAVRRIRRIVRVPVFCPDDPLNDSACKLNFLISNAVREMNSKLRIVCFREITDGSDVVRNCRNWFLIFDVLLVFIEPIQLPRKPIYTSIIHTESLRVLCHEVEIIWPVQIYLHFHTGTYA